MKILYVGELEPGGTCLMRMGVLKELGHEVEGFDTLPYIRWGGKWKGYLFRKFLFRAAASTDEFQPLKSLRGSPAGPGLGGQGKICLSRNPFPNEKSGRPPGHFTTDPAFRLYHSRHLDACVSLYDVVATSKEYELEDYRKKGARNLLLQNPAYDKAVHVPMELSGEDKGIYTNDVVFVGRYEPPRMEFLEALRREGIQLAVWGPFFQENVPGRGIPGDPASGPGGSGGGDYAKALSGAKIGLCFLSKFCPDQITTRTFEIPATGCFMLAERTKEQQAVFREGVEAEYFGDIPEMISKVRKFLSDERARKEIARQGRLKCLEGANSYHDRMEEILKALPKIEK